MLSVEIEEEPKTGLPVVNNAAGVSTVDFNSAVLNGTVEYTAGENVSTLIYWGISNSGTNALLWQNVIDMGIRASGAFSTNITAWII